jgi:hypothetical protein
MMSKTLIQFLALLLCIPSTLALSVSVQQCTGDTDTFSIDYLSITCDDYCTWGSDGTFTGSYTLGDNVSTDSPVISAKIWGVTAYNETVDICDNGNIYNAYGSYCPDAGTYQYVANTELPGSPNSWYTTFSTWVSFIAYTTIDFGDAVVVCQIKIEGQNYDSSSSSYMIAGSTMLFVGFAAFRMKKRRVVATEDEQEGNEYATRFVEMTTA